jgi:hypothetical protein
MNIFPRSFNVAERAALSVFLTTLATMVVKSLWLNNLPAPCEWLAKLSPTGDSVLTSLIAGSLFFLVVNVLFERSEFSRVRPMLKTRFLQVAGQYEGMVRDMANAADVDIPEDVLAVDIKAVLLGLNPNDPAPILANLQGDYLTWLGAIQHWVGRTRKFLSIIERRSNLLKTDSLELLDRVHDSPFFGQVDMFIFPIRNTNLEFLTSSLTRYRDLMREIKAHAEAL